MEEKTCGCGCGKVLPEKNKSGYAWGHKPGPAKPPEGEPELVAPQGAAAETTCSVVMTVEHLDSIWALFPIKTKAFAILMAMQSYEGME